MRQSWMAVLAFTFLGGVVAEARPRLIVFVVIDQLRGDYLEVFSPYFDDAGFNRLKREGACFTHAAHNHAGTTTGSGHATLLTGVTPAQHGIVANAWYDVNGDGRRVYCCGDDTAPMVDGRGAGRSPRRLMRPTLGDLLKERSKGASKVWSIGMKDRAAILTGGAKADGAIWWDESNGTFVSSTYYAPTLPGWVVRFNEARIADRYFQQPWDRLLPASVYATRFFDEPSAAALAREHHANQFPKVLGQGCEAPDRAFYLALYNSPFGNELVLEGARRVIEAEQLGRDEHVDLLSVCFSSNDLVGHRFGPDSEEVMDCTLRTDRQIGVFLQWLDRTVGRDRYLIALSSDHGVGPVAEFSQALGYGGGRHSKGAVKKAVEARLNAVFGRAADRPTLVRSVAFPWLYLDEAAMTAEGLDADRVARVAADAAGSVPGIDQTFVAAEIAKPAFSALGPIERSIRNSYFPGRSGHVYLHWSRYWYTGGAQAGHGSAHEYDQRIPVLISGPGVRAGVYPQPVPPTGIVAVAAACCGLELPAGQVDERMLRLLTPSSGVEPGQGR